MTENAVTRLEEMEVDIELKLAQARLAIVESLLVEKKTRWCELVIFGGAGIALGLALAKLVVHV